MKPRSLLTSVLVIAWMIAGGSLLEPSFAQKASVPKQPNTVAIASEKCKEVLALMDTDKNGKISKQEWMKFMEAEFDRLDTKKTGEIDRKELLQSIVIRGKVRTSDLGK
jgi:CRISPR/Cas system-associated endonuclease Cas3-HD